MEGGLGLRDLFEANRSLLIKRCWEVVSSSSPASTFLRNRFLKENFNFIKSYKKSSVWLGLKKVWSQFFDSLQWRIGDGRRVSFWFDNWLGEPLASTMSLTDCIPSQAKVCNFINNSSWDLPPDLTTTSPQVAQQIMQVHLPLVNTEDTLHWKGSSSGNITAKEAFNFFSEHVSRKDWGRIIWQTSVQPRQSLVVWKALHGKLLTDTALKRRGISLPSCCVICKRHEESIDHLFLRCPPVVTLWMWITSLFSTASPQWVSLEDVLLGSFAAGLSKSKRRLWLLVACNLLWYIWTTRNMMCFEGKHFDFLHAQRTLLGLFRSSTGRSFQPSNNHHSMSIFSVLGISPLSAKATSFIPCLGCLRQLVG